MDEVMEHWQHLVDSVTNNWFEIAVWYLFGYVVMAGYVVAKTGCDEFLFLSLLITLFYPLWLPIYVSYKIWNAIV